MPARPDTAPPDDFVRPDYSGGGLLNLMASLAAACGVDLPYAPLAARFGLSASDFARSARIALVVIDGLGDALLDPRHAPTLASRRVGRLSSVFPSTTASAVTTLLTALPPAQHGLTGWHMWFEEIGQILAVLPLSPRGLRPPDWQRAEQPGRLFAHTPLAALARRRTIMLSPLAIADSPFNRFHSEGAETIAYASRAEFFPRLLEALSAAGDAPLYLHAYLPDLDALMHDVGPDDDAVAALLREIDDGFSRLVEQLAGSGTLVLVTADHGFIGAPSERLIELDAHPSLAAMLARPLCGERRVAYAYVRPECRTAFVAYVEAHLGDACRLFTSREFIAAGWFGAIDESSPTYARLLARAGDYVLVMRGDWTIKDWLEGEKRYPMRGIHGGASAAEMRVPLIVARC